VQGIVTKAGGAIEVRSVLGVGTAVEVVFPRTGA
jgi:signal transduction histidine kinase